MTEMQPHGMIDDQIKNAVVKKIKANAKLVAALKSVHGMVTAFKGVFSRFKRANFVIFLNNLNNMATAEVLVKEPTVTSIFTAGEVSAAADKLLTVPEQLDEADKALTDGLKELGI